MKLIKLLFLVLPLLLASLIYGGITHTMNEISISKGNVKISLDLGRGGQIGSIQVKLSGNNVVELLDSQWDGRGVGASGFVPEPNIVLEAGGCHLNQGNTNVFGYSGYSPIEYIQGYNYLSKNWNNCYYDTIYSYDLDIVHTVSFPTDYDGLIKVDVTYINRSNRSMQSLDNSGLVFPIVPQMHISPTVMEPSTWRYREENGTWKFMPIVLKEGIAEPSDAKFATGNAIAVYKNFFSPDKNFGIALFAPKNHEVFYAKHIKQDPFDDPVTEIHFAAIDVFFLGSAWRINNGLPAYSKLTKTYYIVLGSSSIIESVIQNYNSWQSSANYRPNFDATLNVP